MGFAHPWPTAARPPAVGIGDRVPIDEEIAWRVVLCGNDCGSYSSVAGPQPTRERESDRPLAPDQGGGEEKLESERLRR
jgi:hypothetical protein